MGVVDADLAAPGPGQACVQVRAVGVNFMDVSTRQGFNPVFALPGTPGVEGVGTVVALGDGVPDLQIGQRVAWYYIPGSYSDKLLAPAESLVPVPDDIDDDTAAGILMQGLTARHLSSYAASGATALVHSAAGGVGSLLTQMLVDADVTVIGRVSSAGKADAARRAGASNVIVEREGQFAEQLLALTNGRGVDVVFDGTGAATYHDSVASLRTGGTYAYYGGADDQPIPIELARLPRSILVTHPVVMDLVSTREKLVRYAGEVFGMIRDGTLTFTAGGTYPLDRAWEAHRALESRATTGKLLLRP